MDTQELKTYTLVKDNQAPVLVFILAGIALLLVYFFVLEKPLNSSTGGIIYLAVALVPLFYAFRTRTCSDCKMPMKKKSSALIPSVHYCEKCKKKIETPFMFV